MTYRVLDSKGDYSFGKGKSGFLTDIQAVGQAIYTKLNLLQGEWWENLNEGLPLFQKILGNPGATKELSVADLVVKARILETPNAIEIQSFSSNFDHATRKYTVTAVVNTTYGTTEVTV